MAHIIVVGNEKGGSGKSTTAMHLVTALVHMGHSAAALDLDLRQRSLGRYVENRAAHAAATGKALPMPLLGALPAAEPGASGHPDDRRFAQALDPLAHGAEFVVIDCPGAHTRLSQLAHSVADTLVTPINDSFVDFDLLGRFDPQGDRVLGPQVYAEMVWQARQRRAAAGLGPIDWVVMRNRIGTQNMHNKRRLGRALDALSRRIGFRVGPGFGERVIFRELFPRGLTLLDVMAGGPAALSLSNVAARQELRAVLAALRLPGVKAGF